MGVTPSSRRRLPRVAVAVVVGVLVGYPGAAISEEGAPNRPHTAGFGVQDAARSRPMAAIYGARDTAVVPPVPIFRDLPPWHPAQPSSPSAPSAFVGDVELHIGEDGRVVSTSLLDSIEARYDGRLLESARNWTFTPATRAGVPVKYRYIVTIRLVQ